MKKLLIATALVSLAAFSGRRKADPPATMRIRANQLHFLPGMPKSAGPEVQCNDLQRLTIS